MCIQDVGQVLVVCMRVVVLVTISLRVVLSALGRADSSHVAMVCNGKGWEVTVCSHVTCRVYIWLPVATRQPLLATALRHPADPEAPGQPQAR